MCHESCVEFVDESHLGFVNDEPHLGFVNEPHTGFVDESLYISYTCRRN